MLFLRVSARPDLVAIRLGTLDDRQSFGPPREVWGSEIPGALGHAEQLPTEGDEAFTDDTDCPTFGAVKESTAT